MEIFVVQNEKYVEISKEVFSSTEELQRPFSAFNLKFTPQNVYDDYEQDIKNLSRSWTAHAEVIDYRGLNDYPNQALRLILADTFFTLDKDEQIDILLHEVGHLLTNPNLKEIRNFITNKNPPLLGFSGGNYTELCNLHNEGLSYVFQILKLIQEVNAELWVYENNKEVCEARLARYVSSLDDFIVQLDTKDFDKYLFYDIPKLVFLLIWRQSILKHTEFDFVQGSLEKIEIAFDKLRGKAAEVGYGNLLLLSKKLEIIAAIDYKNENIEKLKKLYSAIFKEYITLSVKFFPSVIQQDILDYYEIN